MKRAAILLVCTAAVATPGSEPGAAPLSLEARIAAEEAIDRVYYSHQIGATRSFDDAVPPDLIRARVARGLKFSAALDFFWSSPITGQALRRETNRITKRSRMPDRLRELEAALGNDPVLIQECLVRPALAERLTRTYFTRDRRIHEASYNEAVGLRAAVLAGKASVTDPRRRVVHYEVRPSGETVEPSTQKGRSTRLVGEDEFRRLADRLRTAHGELAPLREEDDRFEFETLVRVEPRALEVAEWRVPKRAWDDWWEHVQTELDVSNVETSATPSPIDLPAAQAGQPPVDASCGADDTWDNGAFADRPTGRSEFASVWTGTELIIWGGSLDSNHFLNTGGRYDPATDTWTPMSTLGAPSARVSHTAVWSGTEMIVWGGQTLATFYNNSGARYDPATDSWAATSVVGAPSARNQHSAVWTGSAMVVWGGYDGFSPTSSGGRYDPTTNSWTPTSGVNAPSGRLDHSAVSTGSKMIVWGGTDSASQILLTGGVYDPATDMWTPTTSVGAPTPRWNHSAVWTGTEMIVFGGQATANAVPVATGGRYDPAVDSWAPLPTDGAPQPRWGHVAVWTGSEMVVWGGAAGRFFFVNDGGRFSPATGSWRPTTLIGAPSKRADAAGCWTGNRLLVWGGGGDQNAPSEDGARYDPVADVWSQAASDLRPSQRYDHRSIWTGNHMIVWGSNVYSATGGRYDPALDLWFPTSMVGAPAGRLDHSLVWAGDRAIVWGGDADNLLVNTGGRYDPWRDAWAPTSTVGAPTGRREHSAVWTGTRMVIWGGETCCPYTLVDTGGRYDPVTDTWTPTAIAGDPGPRKQHVTVWTGARMLIWGGVSAVAPGRQNTGNLYDPVADTWNPMTTTGAPSGRDSAMAVWTGNRMIVWGGGADSGPLADGGRYDPSTNTWQPMATSGAPAARCISAAVWAGDRMVIWGGLLDCQWSGTTDTGGQYFPTTNSWSPTSTSGAPPARGWHTMVWTGSHVIPWGGRDPDGHELSSGGRWAAGHQRDDDGDGFTECGGDCNDGNGAVHPGVTDTCDGVDNDCDGVIDAGITTPGVVTGLIGGPLKSQLSWSAVPTADRYDVVRGDLGVLRAGLGNFASSLTGCLEPDSSDTSSTDLSSPVPGQGFYYLIRAKRVCKTGSYSEGTGVEKPGRDASIGISPLACP